MVLSRRPARVFHATGREDGLAFNRRYHMADGSVGWNPGKKNPKVVRPAGPTAQTRVALPYGARREGVALLNGSRPARPA